MPQKDSQEHANQEHANNDVENLFLKYIHPLVPKVVGQACAGLGHYPNQIEIDDYVQEINKLLLDNDRRILRSFDHRSKPETYLYTIVRRHILHQLQKRSKMERLGDIPPDSSTFIVQPDQEKRLLAEEMEAILQAAFSRLTGHERKLLSLWFQELSVEEMAKEMGIKKRSISRERIAVIEKLRKVIRGSHEI